jgi:hypothetical protein
MQNKSNLMLVAILLIFSLLLSGCDLWVDSTPDEDVEHVIQTSVALTLESYAEVDPDIEPETEPDIVEPAPTDTPTITISPTITSTPTMTITPSPDTPRVHVDVNTNCRKGPGEPYDILGALVVDQEAEVLGRYQESDYWVIENPDRAGECWIWGYYATLEGPLDDLPYYTQPPTPTPVVDWSGTWTTSHGPPGVMHETYIVTLNQTNSTITGSFTIGDLTVNLSGSLSADDQTLSGTWDDGSDTGPFTWQFINENQFTGNRNSGMIEWCGYRQGAGYPSPCMGP